MYPDTAEYVLGLIGPKLVSRLKRGCQLPPALQFLAVLRFYCTNSFQLVIADYSNVNQSTMCQLVKRVSKLIASLAPDFIKFPNVQEAAAVRQGFYAIAGFPGENILVLCDGH